jgi:polygalacturonase
VACNAAGGGQVVVPAGTYFTGPIRLLSNVNLCVATNATLQFNTDPNAYLPVIFTRYQGIECMNYSPFIYAYQQTNIAITGQGTIDGNGENADWWNYKSYLTYQNPSDEQILWNMASTNLPVAQRVFGAGHYLRPYFIEPTHCSNVLIQGVMVINSPMWTISPLYCTNVTVRNVTVLNPDYSPNTDSCDPDSCTGVLIQNCSFSDGDDCIAVKSGRDQDGLRVNIPSRNIIIRGCTFADGHGGVTLGSEESGGETNIFVEDCAFNSPSLQSTLRIKNNTARGGYVSNVYFRNCITMQTIQAIVMTMVYTSSSPANAGTNIPVIRNIDVRDCAFANISQNNISLTGLDPVHTISNVNVVNCRFSAPAAGNSFYDTSSINLQNNQ